MARRDNPEKYIKQIIFSHTADPNPYLLSPVTDEITIYQAINKPVQRVDGFRWKLRVSINSYLPTSVIMSKVTTTIVCCISRTGEDPEINPIPDPENVDDAVTNAKQVIWTEFDVIIPEAYETSQYLTKPGDEIIKNPQLTGTATFNTIVDAENTLLRTDNRQTVLTGNNQTVLTVACDTVQGEITGYQGTFTGAVDWQASNQVFMETKNMKFDFSNLYWGRCWSTQLFKGKSKSARSLTNGDKVVLKFKFQWDDGVPVELKLNTPYKIEMEGLIQFFIENR